ncbi:MAG: hypothetical protein LBK54_11315 [Propionibacteriaceae bacterium]|jgi:hypothetical protein|nr:hypothetical protein [Propionibacteriaceae bacterium]
MIGSSGWSARLVAGAGLLALTGWLVAPTALADELLARLSDPAIVDPTGLTRDSEHGVYWLVQPSEQETSWVYAVVADGSTKGRVGFNVACPGAAALAWYGSSLFVADIADPTGSRESVVVYGLPVHSLEPEQQVPYSAWRLTYPDGPRDAAAMIVDGSGRLALITTGPDPAIWQAPAALDLSRPNQLTRLAPAPAGVTDAYQLSEDLIALRSASQVYLIDSHSFETVAQGPVETVGGTLSLSLDGTLLVLAGTGPNSSLMTLVPPSTMPGEETPEPEPEESSSSWSSGRLVTVGALSGAGLLALAAGGLAFARR